eukprot:symbB.v1.2.027744.t1/scaffold2865.1/size70676/2
MGQPKISFLRPHPLAQSVTLLRTLKLLPLLLMKLKRLDAIAELHALLEDLLQRKLSMETLKRSEFAFSPFQRVSYGRHHALQAERRVLQHLKQFHLDEETTSCSLLSKVEVEWILEVATTSTGAEEAYDYTRLAWLGDAVVFFIAVALECKEEAPLELRQRRAAALISNRCLAKVAISLGLEKFLTVSTAKKDPPPMGRKVPADALEALLGALLLIGAPSPHTFHGLVESFTGGLQTCFVLMSRLPWFGTEDGDGYCVPFESPSDASAWLGSAVVRLSCTAWLLNSHPELSVERLSDLRQELLTSDLPAPCVTGEDLPVTMRREALESWAGQFMPGIFESLFQSWEQSVSRSLALVAYGILSRHGPPSKMSRSASVGGRPRFRMPPPVPALSEPEPSESQSEHSAVYFIPRETRAQGSNEGWSHEAPEARDRRALSRPLPDTAHLRAVAGGLSLIEKIGHELKRIAQVLGSGSAPPKPEEVPSHSGPGIWEPTVAPAVRQASWPQAASCPSPVPMPMHPMHPMHPMPQAPQAPQAPSPLGPLGPLEPPGPFGGPLGGPPPVETSRQPWQAETEARPGQIRRSRQQRGAPGSGLSPWRPQLEGRPSSSYASFSLSGSTVSSPLNSQFSMAQEDPNRSVQVRAAAICGPKRISARAFQGGSAAPKFLWHQGQDPLDGIVLEEAQNDLQRPQSPLRQARSAPRAGQIQVQSQKWQGTAVSGGPPKAFADALAQAVKEFDGRSPSELNRQASPLSRAREETSLQRQSARTPEPPWANWPQEEVEMPPAPPEGERGSQAETQRKPVAKDVPQESAGSLLGNASEVADGSEFQRRHSGATEDSLATASERSRRRRSHREGDDRGDQSASDRSRRRRRRSEDGTASERSRRSRRSRRDEDDASETTSQHSRRRRRRRHGDEDSESHGSRRRDREEEPEDGQRLERIQEESGSPSSPKESKRLEAPAPREAGGLHLGTGQEFRAQPKVAAQMSMSKSCGSTALPSSPGNFSSATTSSRTMPQQETRPEEEVLSAAEKRWQDEIDSIRRQAMRYSKGQRLRGPSITEDTMNG